MVKRIILGLLLGSSGLASPPKMTLPEDPGKGSSNLEALPVRVEPVAVPGRPTTADPRSPV